MKITNRGFVLPLILGIFVLLVIVAGGLYIYAHQTKPFVDYLPANFNQTATSSRDSNQNYWYFAAMPTSGVVPLTVRFNLQNLAWDDEMGLHLYTINFGDGSTPRGLASVCSTTSSTCTFNHVYTSAGTYTAEFYVGKMGESLGPDATTTVFVKG